MQLSHLQCWLQSSEKHHSSPVCTDMIPISLHATCPEHSIELFNQVVLHIYKQIYYGTMHVHGVGVRASYLFHSLMFLSAFSKKKKKITKNLLVSQVALNSFTTFHSNVKALFQLPRPFCKS